MFDFRFNIPTPFSESGSRKRFHNSAVRAIDFSHKITPKNDHFRKIFVWKEPYFAPPPFRKAIRHALDLWSEVIELDFYEVSNTSLHALIQFEYGINFTDASNG